MPDNEQAAAYPWAPASATGVGSMPGTDPAEAMRLIVGELPELPHLAELPARGPGADLTGRTAALLVDLPVELSPRGWRFAARPGRDLRRARDMLAADLDVLEEVTQGYQGPLKIQAAGPWTLAATIELLRSQDPALADGGAVADLTESLAEGLRLHVDQVSKRVPGARLVLQLDEPALPGVIAGGVRSASGLRRLPAPETPDVEAKLGAVLSAGAAYPVVHCCARDVPFTLIKNAGARGISFDLAQLRRGAEDALAEAAEAGLGILAGVVPAMPEAGNGRRAAPGDGGPAARGAGESGPEDEAADGRLPAAADVARRVSALWQRLGWPVPAGAGRDAVAGQVVLTPACGLAGAPPAYARRALACCQAAARLLPELIEEEAR